MSELKLAQAAVDEALAGGASYADARVVRLQSEEVVVKNGALARAESPEDLGIGLRVLAHGAQGFAAQPWVPSDGLGPARELARRALRVARELGRVRPSPLRFAGNEDGVGEYATPVVKDPFAMPLEDRVGFLFELDELMRGEPTTVLRESSLSLRREEQWQVSSEGARLHQVLQRTGAGLSSTAAVGGVVERRSYPNSFGGNYVGGGWERVEEMDLRAHTERVRDEAAALCHAPLCEPGKHDLILGGGQLMLQIHESVGHPNELDRVFGQEVDLAGSSFATPDMLAGYRYGSDIVNLRADSTLEGGLDTRGYDDECVPSGRFDVVRDGIFQGYHSDREWAEAVGDKRSHSTSRAEGWFNPSIIRMTNLSLLPGTWKLDDLIADTEDGILCDTVRTWSIDQRRLNFQFTTEIGWRIENGERTGLVRRPTYQGSTPEFWRSCDAICDESSWQVWGVPNCGKGNPIQVAEMSHGAAPARFRGVTFIGFA